MPLLDQIREKNLVKLARTRFDPPPTEAEEKVLHDSASSEDPPEPDEKAPRPEVRAAFIRWLATDPEAAPHIDPKGLRVFGVTFPGKLDFKNCRILVTLHFSRCTMKGEFNLQFADTGDIFLFNSLLASAITADGIDVHGQFFFRGSSLSGTIHLPGARIKGDLSCQGAKLKVTEGDGLIADAAEIGGNVFLRDGFESSGEIRLLGAKIKGCLDCSRAKLQVAAGSALSMDGAEIGGNVFLNTGFESNAEIHMPGVKIKGDLDCLGAKLQVRGRDALSADGAEIGGSVYLSDGFESRGIVRLLGTRIGGDLVFIGAKTALVACKNLRLAGEMFWTGVQESRETALDLTGATMKILRDDRKSWPHAGRLILDGLNYEELYVHEWPSQEQVTSRSHGLELPFNAEERIEWLTLQPEKAREKPQPWMQLRDLLERKGDRKGAKHVLFRFRCLQAQESWTPWRWWRIAFAWLEEDLLRILLPISCAVALGTLVFAGAVRSGAMIETVKTQPNMIATYEESSKGATRNPDQSNKPISLHYTSFQPFIYTLENAVPLVKLGMDERWMPDLQHQPQPWCQIGWLGWLKWFNSYGFLVWFRWLLIVWGWIQATVLAAAVADRFKK